MEINWLIIILAFVAILAVIALLIIQNQKDEKALMEKSMEDDEISKEEGAKTVGNSED